MPTSSRRKEEKEMATYTGTGQANRGVGGLIWIAVVAFLASAALVIALAAPQPGTSTTPVRPITVGTSAPRDPEFTQAWLKLLWGSGKTLSYRAGTPMSGTSNG
jgi:hypothetical protein